MLFDPHFNERFDAEHGNYVIHDGQLLFEDGATRTNGNPSLARPVPDDPLEKWGNIKRFYEISLRKAVEAFDQQKVLILNNKTSYDREDEHLSRLKAQQGIVKSLQKKLAQAQEEYNRFDSSYVSPELAAIRAKHEEAEAAKRSNFLDKIKSIEV